MEQIRPTANIAILMATYNGGRFLEEQLKSILCQSYVDWQLFVHDDGSTDNTTDILQQYTAKYPDKIVELHYPPTGSSCQNFLSLLERIEATYYMFCDQDDVWHEDKIAKTLQCMQNAGRDIAMPLVAHTDLRVVDAQLKLIDPSFWHYAGIDPYRVSTFEDCVMNTATGCTMLFNVKARKEALAHPSRLATMHDAWVVCCCLAAKGKVLVLPEATMDYRQHGDNCLGAQDSNRLTLAYRIRNLFNILSNYHTTYRMLNSIAPYSPWTFLRNKAKNSSIFRSTSEG